MFTENAKERLDFTGRKLVISKQLTSDVFIFFCPRKSVENREDRAGERAGEKMSWELRSTLKSSWLCPESHMD